MDDKRDVTQKSGDELSTAKKIGYGVVGAVSLLGLAGYAFGKGVYKAGKFIYDTVDDNKKLLAEIEASNKFCADVKKNVESKSKIYQHEFETIRTDYLRIVEDVKPQFATLKILEQIYFDRESSSEKFSANSQLKLPVNAGMEQITVDGIGSVKKGFGAGLGAGVGAIGLITAFGTAGTGAALSSLTGMAYIHATLAALGGGTLASGGLGMAGGTMVLGATVFYPR